MGKIIIDSRELEKLVLTIARGDYFIRERQIYGGEGLPLSIPPPERKGSSFEMMGSLIRG